MSDTLDIFVIGGGINGCGIARDAAGRGLTVRLAEMGDLASGSSGNTTKLVHGGLRHVERLEFGRLREAGEERETLMRIAPHLCQPTRFVVPYDPEMRMDIDTPAGRILRLLLPFSGGRRPPWVLRLGLGLYHGFGGSRTLPPVQPLDLTRTAEGLPLQDRLARGWEFSDCRVDDTRLVLLNARDAAARGADIRTRTLVVSAARRDSLWHIVTEDLTGETTEHRARVLVNAAGPWAGRVQAKTAGQEGAASADPGLVRGAHVVVPAMFGHDKAYYLQAKDGRYIYVLPFEGDHTLIGTTYVAHPDADAPAFATKSELGFLLEFASRYFRREVAPEDVVWSFAGLRTAAPESADASTTASRDCVLDLDHRDGAPVLSVYSGRLTTYRRQAERALARLAPWLGGDTVPGPWTADAPLPGGDMAIGGAVTLAMQLASRYDFLGSAWARRLARSYGTEARALLAGAEAPEDLGRDFGATLTEREVVWMMEREFAQTAEDVLWRRSKLGLRLDRHEVAALDAFMASRRASAA